MRTIAWLLAALAAMAPPAFAGVEVFEIHYMDARELEAPARTLLGPEGKLTVNRQANIIIVSDRAANIEQIRELIAKLDRMPKTVEVTVEFVEKESLAAAGFGIRWKAAGPGWSIATIPYGSAGSGVNIEARASLSRLDIKRRQFLTILDGRPGKIFVGESVPMEEYYYQYGLDHGYVSRGVRFRDAGTSFEVTADTLPEERVRVTLTPQVSYYDGERKSFTVKNAATEVVISDPGSMVIAGSDEDGESFGANFLRGAEGEAGKSAFAIILSVRTKED